MRVQILLLSSWIYVLTEPNKRPTNLKHRNLLVFDLQVEITWDASNVHEACSITNKITWIIATLKQDSIFNTINQFIATLYDTNMRRAAMHPQIILLLHPIQVSCYKLLWNPCSIQACRLQLLKFFHSRSPTATFFLTT